MICRLCLVESELQDSHIISEFQYKPLYDEKHRFFVISSDPRKNDFYEQKGFREKLLCQGSFLMTVERLEKIEFLREQVMQHSKALNARSQAKEQ